MYRLVAGFEDAIDSAADRVRRAGYVRDEGLRLPFPSFAASEITTDGATFHFVLDPAAAPDAYVPQMLMR